MIQRPAVPTDLPGVLGLFQAYDLDLRGAVDTESSDVTDDWNRPGFDWDRATLVLEGGSRMLGYATVVEEYADVVVAGDSPDALQHLMTWVEQHDGHLELWVADQDVARQDLVAARHWQPARRSWRMQRDLDGPGPTAACPPGVAIRDYARPHDDQAVHELITTAFREIGGQHERSLEQWRSYLFGGGRFEPSLCPVAESGGRVVGAAMSQRLETGEGFLRQLAVCAPQRGCGVGLALLHTCFARHAARGLGVTVLFVDAANATGALALYDKAGMRAVESFTRYDRPADPGLGSGR